MKRLVEGYLVAKKDNKPIILSGGKVFKNLELESLIMRNKLRNLGFDGEIFIDDKSKDTNENAIFVKKIIAANNFNKVLLITSGYHAMRSKMLFEKHGINSCVVLVDKKIDKKYNFVDFLPVAANLHTISKVIKEYLGLLYYSMK